MGFGHTISTCRSTPGSPWSSPVQVAGPDTAYSAPAAALNQATGLISLLVEGPDHSLDDYYVTAGSPWSGPIQVAGPGSTYSAPMAVLNQGTGLISVLVQGPSNSLDDYYVTAGTPWSSAIQVGAAGSTYSAPGAVLNQTTGLISVLVQGPRSRPSSRSWVSLRRNHSRSGHFALARNSSKANWSAGWNLSIQVSISAVASVVVMGGSTTLAVAGSRSQYLGRQAPC